MFGTFQNNVRPASDFLVYCSSPGTIYYHCLFYMAETDLNPNVSYTKEGSSGKKANGLKYPMPVGPLGICATTSGSSTSVKYGAQGGSSSAKDFYCLSSNKFYHSIGNSTRHKCVEYSSTWNSIEEIALWQFWGSILLSTFKGHARKFHLDLHLATNSSFIIFGGYHLPWTTHFPI